ncbi:hypothetical protein ACWN6Y_06890 [Vagococcus teuberi]|uniref:Uncharacterized protein n=1 Tax=Vagococcus teuberi TaxID=519472 RepID=A0A1J0A5P2_9ENTE|nr:MULTISPECIES: hypothetical protein [Vagococcus]APB31253.1 hypothetical protein BHY08_05075 [Vagococcus teuberi]RHH71182.1 hypothetical protein DW196_01200 [Vagococcus sp. AM17-17]
MTDKKLLKSEKIRLKNDKLRAKGKDPLKGWGKMVDTGLGGINKGASVENRASMMDTKDFIKGLQKEIASENEKKNL